MRKLILLIIGLISNLISFSQYPTCPQYSVPARWIAREYHRNYPELPNTWPVIPAKGWMRIEQFSDDFNTGVLDRSKWQVVDNFCHPMSPRAYFLDSPATVYVNGGFLKLRTIDVVPPHYCYVNWTDPPHGNYYNYASGYIQSQTDFHYGYVEIKFNMPSNMVYHPAIWLRGGIWQNGGFTALGEFDVFELVQTSLADNMFMNNVYKNDTTFPDNFSISCDNYFYSSFANQPMIIGIEWFPETINFYLNGLITTSIKNTCEPESQYCNPANYISINPNQSAFPNGQYPQYLPYSDFTCLDYRNFIPMKFQVSWSLVNGGTPNLNEGWDIDYIHSYKLVKSSLPTTYWPLECNLSDPELFKVHENLKFGGDASHTFTLPTSEGDCDIWGTNSIILDKGFSASSEFTGRVIVTDSDLFY